MLHHIPSLTFHNELSHTTQSDLWLCTVFCGSLIVLKIYKSYLPKLTTLDLIKGIDCVFSMSHKSLTELDVQEEAVVKMALHLTEVNFHNF